MSRRISIPLLTTLVAGAVSGQQLVGRIPLPDSLASGGLRCLEYNASQAVLYLIAGAHIVVVDATSGQKLDRIYVGGRPNDLCYVPSVGRLFVACLGPLEDPDTVLYVVDCSRNVVEARVNVGTAPGVLGLGVDSGKVYCMASDSVAVVNVRTLEVVSRFRPGTAPRGFCANPAQRKVYFVNHGSGDVAVVDADTDTMVAVLPASRGPRAICYSPTTNKVYCAGYYGNEVVVYDGSGDSVLATVFVGGQPSALTCSPDQNKVYCTNRLAGTVTAIDGDSDTIAGRIVVGEGPTALEYDAETGVVYCLTDASDELYRIDAAADTVLGSTGVGRASHSLTYAPDLGLVYALGGVCLAAVDGLTLDLEYVTHVWVTPRVLVHNPSNRRLYVLNWDNFATVSVIDEHTERVVGNISVGSQAYDMCLDTANGKLYIPNRQTSSAWDSVITVVDCMGDSVVARVVTGRGPAYVCYNGHRQWVYCTNSLDGTVSVVDCRSDTVLALLSVGADPSEICYNPSDDKVYVANRGSNTVSVISCSTNSVVATVPAPYPGKPFYDQSWNRIYAMPWHSEAPTTVIDGVTDTVCGQFWVGTQPYDACPSSSGQSIFFSTYNGYLTLVDAETMQIRDSLYLGGALAGVLLSPSTGLVYCAARDSGEVVAVNGDSAAVVARVSVGSAVDPVDLVACDWRARVYVANFKGSSVGVLSDSIPSPIAEPDVSAFVGRQRMPTVVLSKQALPGIDGAALLDITGRRVMALGSGENDIWHLAPGVYFIKTRSGTRTRRVVVAR